MSVSQSITYLKDYKPSDFLIDTVSLNVILHPTETLVTSHLSIRRNPGGQQNAPLILDGDELTLVSLKLNQQQLPSSAYELDDCSLTIHNVPDQFQLTIDTLLNPSSNSKLMGLYRSSKVFTTQCEADGFRRITYFLDRPDVLSIYTTRIEGNIKSEPILLGNGNPVEQGMLSDERHFAVWHDPFPKPCYLFALVGGDLDALSDQFTTQDGRSIKLNIYVEKGNRDRTIYAMDSLKRSMKWDEKVFGCIYDLEVFNVVAVSDFNMGAMENKGLNIFNDKYVLASPELATDTDYAGIESVIAHEYFHNWTGNRITCRDWFQLCLKEGLTVFRDQEFSSDQRSRPVIRIQEVKTLRSRQFPEDASSLAHPVRPNAYKEINNFYTATVYEKGAELIRMLKILIGDDIFFKGMRFYLDTFDGTAATIEQFIACFEKSSGKNLQNFFLWYEQSGTPHVSIKHHYDSQAQTYELKFKQKTQPTADQPGKKPLVIPVLLDLIYKDGTRSTLECEHITDGLFVFEQEEQTITFTNVQSEPVPSLFQNLSAPVTVDIALSLQDQRTLLQYDLDPFNRWQAAQNIALTLYKKALQSHDYNDDIEAFGKALDYLINQIGLKDPAFTALVLTLPSDLDLARDIGENLNPDALHNVCKSIKRKIGQSLFPSLLSLRKQLDQRKSFTPDATSAGKRSLYNAALNLIASADEKQGIALSLEQLRSSNNMTNRLAALSVISTLPGKEREQAFTEFGEHYKAEPLVLDKWFALQATLPEDDVLERIERLRRHPMFSLQNPNRTRALFGSFAMSNQVQFNREDGKGYRFVTSLLEELDPINPQIASMVGKSFSLWKSMEPKRAAEAKSALSELSKKSLSRDLADIIERCLR